ncbi:MAG: hypothetical protein CO108_02285 [Deltaproteobacteria bacterium CG_4_9_14_3_um_filter_63_12]|nr:MAG: hypothetical protein CO108_02285 [Deltaproteobacteria bacterium CG_4_9_14_3_um_filter_63_12]
MGAFRVLASLLAGSGSCGRLCTVIGSRMAGGGQFGGWRARLGGWRARLACLVGGWRLAVGAVVNHLPWCNFGQRPRG